eukprot:14297087-Ditylum_brightwellii.AAC.1
MTASEKYCWAKFWKYFEKNWLRDELIAMYNVNTETCDVLNLQNCTKNALEHYNRHLKEISPMAHPNLTSSEMGEFLCLHIR